MKFFLMQEDEPSLPCVFCSSPSKLRARVPGTKRSWQGVCWFCAADISVAFELHAPHVSLAVEAEKRIKRMQESEEGTGLLSLDNLTIGEVLQDGNE